MQLMIDEKEIKRPYGDSQFSIESTKDSERYTNMRISKRENEHAFIEEVLLPGEFAEIVDKHTLAFCFAKGDVAYLNLDETVSEETAKELISRIKEFIENSYKVHMSR